jgi:divalent metal cation (Fe/Co/Zn/Cd) transporter
VSLFVSGGVALANGHVAEDSPWGIAYLVVTAMAMFGLAAVKRRIGRRAGSAPIQAEAAMTFLDGWLATGILAALVLNAALGWWWADPIAAMLVGVAALAAARESWRAAD